MPLGTHRQRVPAMLAVAVVGMLVYSAAGAASNDGKDLSPAKSSTTTTSRCEPARPGDRDDDGKGTTSTTRKRDDDRATTSTTRKDDDDRATTSTTRKDDDDRATTSTTREDDDKRDVDPRAAKAAAPSGEMDVQGAAVATAAKDTDANGKDTKADPDRDCGATTTTRKGDGGDKDDDEGKGSTSTTRKRGTTTTTGKSDRDDDKGSTTTTRQRGAEPHTPGPAPGGSPDPGGSGGSDQPGGSPIAPQEAPPSDAPDPDPGPAAEPEAAADDGPVDGSGSFDMWDDEEDHAALDPTEAPGSGSPLPVFNQLVSTSGGASADVNGRERSRSTGSRPRGGGRGTDDSHELASSPEAATFRSLSPAAVTESESVRRRLGGTRAAAVTESAFPADVISTPADLPLNRRNPLAAAALVLLAGVSRELFKVWRRRASDFWPA